MNIAVDLDDTIGDQLCQLVLFYNETYGTSFKKDDFSTDYQITWGGTNAEAVAKVRAFIESVYFLDIKPIPGAFEALMLLKEQGHTLFLVTGREYRIKELTQAWIEKYFPGIFSGIYYTNSYMDEKKSIKKSIVCREIGAFVIIEDDLRHINDCLEAGIEVIILNAPRNNADLPSKARRFDDWWKIIEAINEKTLMN